MLVKTEFASRDYREFNECHFIIEAASKQDFSLFYEVLDHQFVEPLLHFLVKDTYLTLTAVHQNLERLILGFK